MIEFDQWARIPGRGDYSEQARWDRLSWLRERSSAPLEELETMRLNPHRLVGNVENLVGAVEIPIGLVGPLVFDGTEVRGSICAPLATTEGALVASATRGATAISRSGGVRTCVMGQRMTRIPGFRTLSLADAATFARWIGDHTTELEREAARGSAHAVLSNVHAVILGRSVHVDLGYETADAAGQNMVSICTWYVCQWVLANTPVPIEHFMVDGNLSGDKKATQYNLLYGRGTRVAAEAELTADALADVLHTNADHFLRAYRMGSEGVINSGAIGHTVCPANIIAGMFAALGQDIAATAESSVGFFELEPLPDGGVYASLLLPALIVGTVGGGTDLPVPRALLEMLGCPALGGQRRLAEIVAGFCLSLELSTLAAMAMDTFVTAHEQLGRNRPAPATSA